MTEIRIYPLIGSINEANVKVAVEKSSLTRKKFDGRIIDTNNGSFYTLVEVDQTLTSNQKDVVKGYFPGCYVEFI